MSIRKATVLGAGVMGSQIAALLVNAGLKVQLLDIVIDENDKNKISKGAYDQLTNRKRPQLFDLNFASNLSYGNFDEDLAENDSDIFIEAVKEDIEIKHDLWKKVAAGAKESAIFATNTSGIPIEAIAEAFGEADRNRFVGMHFFNPPRIMKLVELIPNSQTDQAIIDQITEFSEDVLGKGVVLANDVPAFVGNRIGTHTMNDIIARAEGEGLSITEVDALTGKAIGRPRTGTYGLVDLVGLDIATAVIGGMKRVPEEAEFFPDTVQVKRLMEAGALGNKTKQGFYKKEGRKRLVFNPETGDYVEPEKPQLEILAKLGKDLKENMDVIFNATDEAGKFLWTTLRNTFHYSAVNVPKATEDYKNIDRAMVWGFNWKQGPFQLWDLMGFDRVKDRMKEELGSLPEWIENRTEPFYGEGEILENITPISEFIDEEIWNTEDSNLSVANDDQLLFKLQSKNNVITDGFTTELEKAIDTLENNDYSSMVIYSEGYNFSVGANLYGMLHAVKEDKVDELVGPMIEQLHRTFSRMKYSTKPIVTAVQGKTLGGGAELLLHSPYVVAATETYVGLVEVGVGLIPSGGGLAEFADRVLHTNHRGNDKQSSMTEVLMNVGTAKVSQNAYEAKALGFLRDRDTIIMNASKRVEVALNKAKYLSQTNYIPQPEYKYLALGSDYKALVAGELDSKRVGNFISDYDYELTLEVAHVLSGGELPRNTYVNQRYLQRLEKEGFLKALKNQKTVDRIKHMLETGRPLRN